MKCPACLKQLTRVGRFWICPEHGQISIDDTDRFNLDVSKLPSIIAIPIKEYLNEDHPVMRLHRMCDAVEIITRFFTIIGLSFVRQGSVDNNLPKDIIKACRDRIERPTLGKWVGMLQSIYSHINRIAPELLLRSVNDLIVLIGTSKDTHQEKVLALRNLLVHGGGMKKSAAKRLLSSHKTQFHQFIDELKYLAAMQVLFVKREEIGILQGPNVSLNRFYCKDEMKSQLEEFEGHIVLVHENKIQDLWPLVLYGQASSKTLSRIKKAKKESPMIYFRSEETRLIFAALGVSIPMVEEKNPLSAFKSLFQLDKQVPEKTVEDLDFEKEIRLDSEKLIGRTQEIKQAKAKIKEANNGVLWITGEPGIGKSIIMARLAHDLGNDPIKTCRIAYRFKAGDPRCTRVGFLQHAVVKLSSWLDENANIEHSEKKLLEQLKGLLEKVSEFKPNHPLGKTKRVLIFLDGLDEIFRFDEGFPKIPFMWRYKNVIWICAGRPENELKDIFRPDSCEHVCGEIGLPKMKQNEIRGMLLTETGSIKYHLLERDIEEDGGVTNEFVDAVIEKAKGLPIYVHFVIQDVLSFKFNYHDEDKLPPTLMAYYDEIRKRLALGDKEFLFSPVVVTLARSMSPLDEFILYRFLLNRKLVLGNQRDMILIKEVTNQLQGVILQTAPTFLGKPGYTLFHDTFRNYVREAVELESQNELTNMGFFDLVNKWKKIEDRPTQLYALKFGPTHLIEGSRWESLEILLTDLEFIQEKCISISVYDLIKDYLGASENNPNILFTAIGLFLLFLQKESHLINHYPELVYQLALNQPDKSTIFKLASKRIGKKEPGSKWFNWENKPQEWA